MKLPVPFGLALRWGAALAAVLAFASPVAHAATATDPIYPPLFVHMNLEPANPCPDSTVYLHVGVTDSCMYVFGFGTIDSMPTVTVRRGAPMGQACARNAIAPHERRYPLGRFAAGYHQLKFRLVVIVPDDSSSSSLFQEVRTLELNVGHCQPPPVGPPHGVRLLIGEPSECATCPPVACPGAPVPAKLLATEENSCVHYLGWQHVPSLSTPLEDVLLVRFRRDCTDSLACLQIAHPVRDSFFLPAQFPGRRAVRVLVSDSSCADSVRIALGGTYAYTVLDSCGPPPPQPGVLPHGVEVAIGPPSPCLECEPTACPNQPVLVRLHAQPEHSCVRYEGLRVLPLAGAPDRDVLLVTFRLACPDSSAPCLMYAPPVHDSIFLPAQSPGLHRLEVRVMDVACADSLFGVASKLFTYHVLDSCGPPPPPPAACVMPFLTPAPRITADVDQCDLRIAPGATGRLVLNAFADGVRLAGLQGTIAVSGAPLRIERLEATGVASGMKLQTRSRDDGGMDWVLWAEHGAPVPAGAWSPVLAAVLRADSAAIACTSSVVRCALRGLVSATVTSASDSAGTSIAPCPVQTFAPVVAVVCVTPREAPSSCDANRDGIVNVADLVRMVRCWYRPLECPDTLAAHPDCNGDGVHSPIDILCCARGMLGGPRDSTARTPGALNFAFGEPRLVNGRVELPLTVRGGGELGGALLRLACPADRYAWDDGIVIDGLASMTDTGTDANWLVTQDADGDHRLLGMVRLGESASDEITTTLYLRLRDGQEPGGTVTIIESDLSGTDGVPLDLDLAAVRATLPPAAGSTVTRLELSAARPNPTGGATTFSLALPTAGEVDLGIFDLAGRRVATLWSGRLAAGTREFTWSGAAQNGVYFARLVVDGEVRTSRVVLRKLR